MLTPSAKPLSGLSNMEFIAILLFGPCALLFLDLNKSLF